MPETTTAVLPTEANAIAPTGRRLPEVLPPYADTDAGQIQQIDDVLKRFHDDTHCGPFRFCYERPCREVAGITRGSLL